MCEVLHWTSIHYHVLSLRVDSEWGLRADVYNISTQSVTRKRQVDPFICNKHQDMTN
uniref:Uncharacterized protein n=1 Tax=Papilio xuthus TaxID=66420 RepID=I4DQM3_PAPXU|nr:unknown unsecreted protein [Papilio xuthus]